MLYINLTQSGGIEELSVTLLSGFFGVRKTRLPNHALHTKQF